MLLEVTRSERRTERLLSISNGDRDMSVVHARARFLFQLRVNDILNQFHHFEGGSALQNRSHSQSMSISSEL